MKLICVGLGCVILLFFIIFQQKKNKEKFLNRLGKYIENTYKIERQYIEKLPIYADYIEPKKVRDLRKYLMSHHMRAVKKRETTPIKNDREITIRVKKNTLRSLANDTELEKVVFFYNVPKKYRYLSPSSRLALLELGRRFQYLLEKKDVYTSVLIALSSALRPSLYQKKLGYRNTNATLVSSHSYGESFDIFLDEFYVRLEEIHPKTKDDSQFLFEKKLRTRVGFRMGQALRRQFQSMLTEAVLQLQEEEKIYAIWEKKQRCYHITAR